MPIYVVGQDYHLKTCLVAPVFSSIVFGGVFSGLDYARGDSGALLPKRIGQNMLFIYLYHALQCPFEVIHGRRSLIHNGISGGILGYIGVSQNRIGIPFVGSELFWKYPSLRPATVGAVMYGGIGMFFGALGGKQL